MRGCHHLLRLTIYANRTPFALAVGPRWLSTIRWIDGCRHSRNPPVDHSGMSGTVAVVGRLMSSCTARNDTGA